MAFSDCPLSTLPSTIDSFVRRQDLTVDDLSLVSSFETKYNSGDFAGANAIITANPTLKTKITNAECWNELRDAIIALEHMFLNDIDSYIINVANDLGAYSPNTVYNRYDIVTYVADEAEMYFVCEVNNTPKGTLPTNTSYFRQTTMRGKQGASGIGLTFRLTWVSTTAYAINESISYQGIIYQCIQACTGQIPSTATTYWTKILYQDDQIITSSTQPSNQKTDGYWFQIV